MRCWSRLKTRCGEIIQCYFLDYLLVLLLATLMDFAYPYHTGLLLRIHPVHTSYVMAIKLWRPFSSRVRGVAIWIAVVLLHLLAYSLLVYYSLVNRLLFIVISAYVLKTSFSLRLLLDIVERVAVCLKSGDLEGARFWVRHIVRRDVKNLGEPHLASAAIESLAESLVDGYVSPLFYYIIFGPLGALFQRIVNTLDSALGYKEPSFRDAGWFSAKVDTVVNYIPARVTGLLIAIASLASGGRIREVVKTMIKEHGRTESVNAGYPMSAMAGALNVRLEKIGYYTINGSARWPGWSDVLRALRVAKLAVVLWLATSVGIILIASGL
ncbi:MAG: cobalamin biosynthesis protein [Sulfolobales archaeon]